MLTLVNLCKTIHTEYDQLVCLDVFTLSPVILILKQQQQNNRFWLKHFFLVFLRDHTVYLAYLWKMFSKI